MVVTNTVTSLLMREENALSLPIFFGNLLEAWTRLGI